MQQKIRFHKNLLTWFLLWSTVFAGVTKANPIDSITAKAVGTDFYSRHYKLKTPLLSLVYTETSSKGEAEYYIYNLRPDTGFVIVSAEDGGYPILGYSSEGYYNASHLSPEFAYWMQRYKKQIEQIRLHNTLPTSDIQNEWSGYTNNLPVKSTHAVTSSVNPLVTTIWDQSPYSNADCPGGSLAGCVATAMAQIMKYWAYPPHGISSHSYNDTPYGTLFVDFDSSHYDWADMPANVIRTNAAVASVMYDCGVSVNMSYSPTSSGSYMIRSDNPPSGISAQTAFVTNFGYNGSSIQGLYMSNYSNASWVSLLQNELNNNRPLFYAGSGDSGAHAWVCDGYNTSGDFHMNWGWQGYEDGYYTLSSLNPDGIPLNTNEEALIGIEPNVAIADFSANTTIIRAGDTVNFIDNSFGYVPITSWQWSLPGASGNSSIIQNPEVIYPNPGIYNVSETVAGSEGGNTLSLNKYITVLVNNTVNVYPTLSDGNFTIQLHDASLAGSNLEFSIYNMLGQKMYSTTLVQFRTQISIVVPHGMYFFRAFDISGKPISTGRLVIK